MDEELVLPGNHAQEHELLRAIQHEGLQMLNCVKSPVVKENC